MQAQAGKAKTTEKQKLKQVGKAKRANQPTYEAKQSEQRNRTSEAKQAKHYASNATHSNTQPQNRTQESNGTVSKRNFVLDGGGGCVVAVAVASVFVAPVVGDAVHFGFFVVAPP